MQWWQEVIKTARGVRRLLYSKPKPPLNKVLTRRQLKAHGRTWIVIRYLGEGVSLVVSDTATMPADVKVIYTGQPEGWS